MLAAGIAWLRRRPRATLGLIGAYAMLTMPTHDRVNEGFLWLQEALGPQTYSALMLALTLLGLGATAIPLLRDSPRLGSARLRVYWMLLLALCATSVWLLMAVTSESIHFLQYAILAVPLWALTGSAVETMVWATWIGCIDEWVQYSVLHRGWAIYYDFNDILLNLLGAVLGILLILATPGSAGARSAPSTWAALRRSHAVRLTIVLLALLGLGWVTGVVQLYPGPGADEAWLLLSRLERAPGFWIDEVWSPKRFHVLHPLPGIVAVLAVIVAFAPLDARVRSVSPGNDLEDTND